jgi:hypothetical protein
VIRRIPTSSVVTGFGANNREPGEPWNWNIGRTLGFPKCSTRGYGHRSGSVRRRQRAYIPWISSVVMPAERLFRCRSAGLGGVGLLRTAAMKLLLVVCVDGTRG